MELHNKQFLLGNLLEDFQKTIVDNPIVSTPKTWNDAFFKSTTFCPKEMKETWLIKKYLEQQKIMLNTFFEDELPRPLITSINTLLKTINFNEKLEWNQNSYNKEMQKAGLPLHIAFTPERQRRKLIQLDGLLRKKFKLKLFFLLDNEITPYDCAATGLIYFFLKTEQTEYFVNTDSYTIADISCIQDETPYKLILEKGFRYNAYIGSGQLSPTSVKFHTKQPFRTFLLTGGLIDIFYALHPQLNTLITYDNKEWNNSKVLIVKETNGAIIETDRVSYFRMIGNKFLNNKPFTHTGYIFLEEERRESGIHLLIKWTDIIQPTITKEEALSIVRQMKEDDRKAVPFPFFGAGHAEYFEWAELTIRFIIKPDKEQIDKIIRSAPLPIRPSESDFIGKMLHAGSVQFVNRNIEKAYGNGEMDEKKNAAEEDWGEDSVYYYVSPKAAAAFEADIERWLIEINPYSPIEYAYRGEDTEANGTQFSGWHWKSVTTIPSLLSKWSSDESTFIQSEEEASDFKYALTGILNYSNISYDSVPEKIIDAFFSWKKLEILLDKPDLTEALTIIKCYHKDANIKNSVVKKLKKFINEKNYSKVNLLTELLCDINDKANMFELDIVGEVGYAALKENNQDLINKFVKTLSNKTDSLVALGVADLSCAYANNIGAYAYSLIATEPYPLIIRLFEIALDIITPTVCSKNFELYCNALWVLQKDNTDLPVNKVLNEEFLAKCMPYAPQNPAIYFNAACLYVEMKQFDIAMECIYLAKKHNYISYKGMVDSMKKDKMFSALRKYPAFVDWVKKK